VRLNVGGGLLHLIPDEFPRGIENLRPGLTRTGSASGAAYLVVGRVPDRVGMHRRTLDPGYFLQR